VTRTATPKLGAYAGLTALGLLAALALSRPELVVIAAPFGLALVAGLALSERPAVKAVARLDRERTLEGDEVVLELELAAETSIARLEVVAPLPAGIALVDGPAPVAVRLAAGERRTLRLVLRSEHWGGYVLGRVHLRAHDPVGLLVYETTVRESLPLRVYPSQEWLRRLVAPLETQVSSGNEVSRRKAEGIEFADVREYQPGDLVRRVNWRVSARRGELWVNESHPERNTDVIVFLDSFVEARRAGTSTLDLAVRAGATLAARYLARRDRVGVVGFGGILRWLLPGTGLAQLYRIVESLIDTEIVLNYAWKDLDIIPRRTLPPQALVLALTPLLDERAVGALLDLRARGFDVAVLEVSPEPFAAEPNPRDEVELLGHRIWRLRREALRSRYRGLGIPLAVWRHDDPLQTALEEVRESRRRARH
jgi:uncharacterized protein (DUF58 family)